MISLQKSFQKRGPATLCGAGVIALLALQFFWLYQSYQLTRQQLISNIEAAFEQAYQKEQTYRIPINGIVPQGNLTIESCGKEEIRIIRHCPDPDTVTYDNIYGQSMEMILNRAFRELRESLIPLNLYCLSDLFAGELYERDITISFVIERYNPTTGTVLESSGMPDAAHPVTHITTTLTSPLSETENLRVNLQFFPSTIFHQMSTEILISFGLLLLTTACLGLSGQTIRRRAQSGATLLPTATEQPSEFPLGHYSFNYTKNELQSFGQTITLAKKENALLYELCINAGNVVGRDMLLEKYWEGTGFVYTRSLDTYIARLRKLLSNDPAVQIITIKGVGYKLTVQTP
ncbi:MAG: winged helix-turn-helix domain-containing protein [Prevotellaceae bacterium]|jgi:DNA-binding winged helix-turn-helix (wHTH) protein|nr:winged helix-turn-helix domain-containing protein [Prevotellaceae bacterium]